MQLTGRSIAAITSLGEEIRYPEGSYLWREGDAGDFAAWVLEGKLEVLYDSTANADAVHLREVGPGNLVGELACLDGLARSASVRAVEPSRIIRIPAEQLRQLVKGRSEIFESLFWEQVERVRSLTKQVTRSHRRAITDSLTTLYNFGFFKERLALEVGRARQTGDPISLVIFDIDHFKHFNDTQGHPEGNRVLVTVAGILKGAGRRGDIVARYGGEEFAVLLYGATRMDAWLFAESVRTKVASEEIPGGKTQPLGRLTLSGGVATFPEDAPDDDELVKAADARLYEAKAKGRNRIHGNPDGD